MKRIMTVLAALGLCVVVAKPVMAQGTRIGIGGGLTLPMSDYGDQNVYGDKSGYHFGADASFGLGTAPIRLRLEGNYSKTSHQTGIAGNTTMMGGMVSLVYPFATTGSIKPYILGGVGYNNIKESSADTSKSSVSYGAGAGIRFPLSSASLFLEARYLSAKAFDLTFAQVPITLGVSFPVGGKK